jgi:hypothetical protein
LLYQEQLEENKSATIHVEAPFYQILSIKQATLLEVYRLVISDGALQQDLPLMKRKIPLKSKTICTVRESAICLMLSLV